MKIALDVDSTLAATNTPAFDYLADEEDHDYDYDSIESWDWGAEEFGLDEFLGALHHAWVYDVDEIPPMEEGLPETVDSLREDHTVHVVTHQPDDDRITEGKKEWLDQQGIEYDAFRPVSRDVSKGELDYDAFIDDKPTLPENAENGTVYLLNHQYNRDAPGDYVRVPTVKDAAFHIRMDDLARSVEREITHMEELGLTGETVDQTSPQELINEVNQTIDKSYFS